MGERESVFFSRKMKEGGLNLRRIGKRLTALGIAAALTLTNIGNTLSTVYAASGGEHRDLSVRGADLAGAIMDMILILSILVDTFSSRISLTMPPSPKPHNTACVLS